MKIYKSSEISNQVQKEVATIGESVSIELHSSIKTQNLQEN